MTIDHAPTTEPRNRWLVVRAIQVRLRFVAILVVAFLVAGQWEGLRNRWETLSRSVLGGGRHADAVSPDTEYFCPMDPGVVSEWPGKCGICNMGLVRRKTGDTAPLPSGVVARMQFSPYRIQLAGIRTAPVGYEPLARDVTLLGVVTAAGSSPRVVEAELFDRDRLYVVEGLAAEVSSVDQPEMRPLAGKVRSLEAADAGHRTRVVMEVADPDRLLRPAMVVTIRARRPIAELEPFRSLPANPPPLRKGEALAVYLCAEHPEVLSQERGTCPIDRRNVLERRPLLDNQRLAWWCPMHPTLTSERPGLKCDACGGMTLVPRIVTYQLPGKVLTVPESAVVDTGTRAVVFVERMPGMFDGVEVVLGPRCGDAYPVLTGLEPGQLVATSGAFLIDAETRLNPSLAASYFGSSRGDRPVEARRESTLGISAEEEALAALQKVCPVTGKPLGSMGTPVRVTIAGKAILICCEGCEEKLKKDPEKYLRKSH